jgi:hypothetical protein
LPRKVPNPLSAESPAPVSMTMLLNIDVMLAKAGIQ